MSDITVRLGTLVRDGDGHEVAIAWDDDRPSDVASRVILEHWSTVPCSLCGHVENQCWPLWDAVALWALMTAIQESHDDDDAFDPLLTGLIRD